MKHDADFKHFKKVQGIECPNNRRTFEATEAILGTGPAEETFSYLSSYQSNAVEAVRDIFTGLAEGIETGPLYVPMPTGCGKTTGAILGIADVARKNPNSRICFLSPYIDAVSKVYEELASLLGPETVGYYYFRDSGPNKEEALSKRVVVLTHSFVGSNAGRLDDRDLFIVDEAIYATGETTLRLSDIYAARAWANRNNVLSHEFDELGDFAYSLDCKQREEDQRYLAAELPDDTGWVKRIAFDLNLSGHAQTIENMETLVACQGLCKALLAGLVFLSKGNVDAERSDPVFSASILALPNLAKTLVLTATGELVYRVAGDFKKPQNFDRQFKSPRYPKLQLIELTGPDIQGNYGSWGSSVKSTKVIDYFEWVIDQINEKKIYVSMPKQVIERCLLSHLGQAEKGEIQYPFTVSRDDKELVISHHAVGIGSNEFRDCEAAVYLWDNHLPQSASIQRYHTLRNEPILQADLESANTGQLSDHYKEMKTSLLIENIMQQLGRGNIRNLDEHGNAGEMKAYAHSGPNTLRRLAIRYPGSTMTKIEYEGAKVRSNTNRWEAILGVLFALSGQEEIKVTDMEETLGFDLRRYRKKLIASDEVAELGYEFVPGTRGRGNCGVFRLLGGD